MFMRLNVMEYWSVELSLLLLFYRYDLWSCRLQLVAIEDDVCYSGDERLKWSCKLGVAMDLETWIMVESV